MLALDYMIKNDQYSYHCDPWYSSPGDEHYMSMKGVSGQVNYRGEIFVVTHHTGHSGSGGMDEGCPDSVTIMRIKPRPSAKE